MSKSLFLLLKKNVIHYVHVFQDEESANKFRSITEAYEVLGNIKLKKMYDKGSTVNYITAILLIYYFLN